MTTMTTMTGSRALGGRAGRTRLGRVAVHAQARPSESTGEARKTSRRASLLGALLVSLPLGLGARQTESASAQEMLPPPEAGLEVATFAGGCFWCMEPPFDKVRFRHCEPCAPPPSGARMLTNRDLSPSPFPEPIQTEGVLATTSGYTGGDEASPSYRQVSSGTTGHAESLQVLYDPKKVTYEELLDVYWHQIDPTVKDRQFCDGGKQYRSVTPPSLPSLPSPLRV